MRTVTKNIIDKALQVNLIDIIREKGIHLKNSGKEYSGLCPFHKETNPSFFVNPTKQLYHCFGCGASGNAINFLVKHDNLKFIDVIDILLKRQGTSYLKETASQKNQATSKTPFPKLLNRVMDFYHRTFTNSPDAIQYLSEERKIKNSAIFNTFKIGYADGSILKAAGTQSKSNLKTLGILTKRGYEFFNGCIVFPILDEHKKCVGMYGRRIKAAKGKSNHLYLPGPIKGVFNSLAAKRNKEIILAESIIDALSGIANGYTNIIPIYGTNGLTEHHINLFKEYQTKRIIFAFDPDKAGNEAIPKVINRLKNLTLTFSKITLPDKLDLNEYFKLGKNGEFKKLIDTAEKLNADKKDSTRCLKVNGNEITFTSGKLAYTVRGLNLYGFSRMKVNIRARLKERFHIDTIDLYANKSRTTFINQSSKRLELDVNKIENDVFLLIQHLERLRDEHIKAEENKEKIKIPVMTDSLKHEALKFLTNPNLINEIIKDITNLGHVGEEINKAIGYLVSVSRKLAEPLSCIIISRSGAGKSELMEKVEQLTPPEDLVQFSSLTPQALYYMDKDELVHKLLLIEERAGSDQADYSIRELQTKKVLRKGVPIKDPNTGKIKTIRLEVNGPISYMESTTNSNINPENTNRCFILHIDESVKQTKRIHELQRKSKTLEGMEFKIMTPRIIAKHQNAQRLLKAVKVINPFSGLITFPDDRLRTRRDFMRFLNLIEAVTYLHQFQRDTKIMTDKVTGEVIKYVESSIDDYKIAYDIIKKILAATLDEMPKNSRDLLAIIQEYVKMKQKKTKLTVERITFTRREIREYSKWSNDQIKNHIKKLEDMEYLIVTKGARGQQYVYALVDGVTQTNDFIKKIPAPSQLNKKIKA